ncbi:putative transmembrane protein [Hydrogenophaga sp. RAC07]|uniref:DUF1439 domain-containing protein n=1 Tax=Hydrogenophaga sp. RAC07 TaxID=1842537 RepID=UPI00083CFD16|nr:DUF1439 domain-containing protein [Hydrogenophaga sp. RAC07]AOF85707.1 putative transmembrane protein [Hydrogenophaga sp. RAC07]
MRRRTLLSAALCGTSTTLAWARAPEADDPPSKPPGVTVPTAVLQSSVAQRFPIRYPVQGLLNLDLQPPTLSLLPAQNRLRAAMEVDAAGPALNRSHRGTFDLDFALRYEASDRTLRAHQLRIDRLRFPSLQPGVVELLNTYAPALAEQSLREVVLHRLQPQDLRMADAMGMQPGTITVTDAGLVIGFVLKPL